VFFGGRGRDLFVVRSNGNDLTRITESPRSEAWPAWSPDGESIAFVCWAGTNPYQICTIRNGTHPRRLTDYPVTGAADPAWSPDGERIAFEHGGDLSTMRPDGSHVRQVPQRAGLAAIAFSRMIVSVDWSEVRPGRHEELKGAP
jgi:Tol biopolymer transport system component